MIELLIPPMLAGLLVAIVSGPLGCFVVWNRMAYFGDTLAHSALLGVSLALLLSLNVNIGIFIACFAIAGLLLFFGEQNVLPRDTLLGIFAHGSLALGLVLSSFIEGLRLDLMAFLFGDILSVSLNDLILVGSLSLIALIILKVKWRDLLNSSIDSELAQVEGINTQKHKALLMFLLAAVIAFAIKIIGVLLISALLIIPAATARGSAKTPGLMAISASLFASTAVIAGLLLSWFADSPAGPSIVLCSFIIFILSSMLLFIKARLDRA
jgi:zinc transport system permease protein